MKKIKFLSICCAISALLGFSSCMDSKEDNVTVIQQLSNYFNVYTDAGGNQVISNSSISYTITYNYSKATADVSIVGIKLPDGGAFPSLQFTSLPLSQDASGWKKISSMSPNMSGSNFAVTFTNLNLNIADRYIGNDDEYYQPATDIYYTIDGWTTYSFPVTYSAFGTPKVTSDTGVYESDSDDSPYSLAFDPEKKTCNVYIDGMRFDSAMPSLKMLFKDIPFTVSAQTITVAQADAFNPYVVNGSTETPFTRGQISNFRVVFNPTKGMTMKFDFDMDGKHYTADVNSLYSEQN